MELKIVTYNIDGLPSKLDLKDLPWFLRPVAWIYKLIKKTTEVAINDNGNKEECMAEIGKFLKASNADIIGVQEDFNYHKVYTRPYLEEYSQGTHQGGFDLKKGIRWFPYPRFRADGLDLFVKNGKVKIKEEKIVKWDKSCGYISHANDRLTQKGFRCYTVTIENKVDIDIYILHMDADFYHPENCPDVKKDIQARASQLKQLSDYITERFMSGFTNPIIVMGDMNSSPEYQWDVNNINEYLVKPLKGLPFVGIKEVVPSNEKDVDRIFAINNIYSNFVLIPSGCAFGLEIGKGDGKPSDHWPLMATFVIKEVFVIDRK